MTQHICVSRHSFLITDRMKLQQFSHFVKFAKTLAPLSMKTDGVLMTRPIYKFNVAYGLATNSMHFTVQILDTDAAVDLTSIQRILLIWQTRIKQNSLPKPLVVARSVSQFDGSILSHLVLGGSHSRERYGIARHRTFTHYFWRRFRFLRFCTSLSVTLTSNNRNTLWRKFKGWKGIKKRSSGKYVVGWFEYSSTYATLNHQCTCPGTSLSNLGKTLEVNSKKGDGNFCITK